MVTVNQHYKHIYGKAYVLSKHYSEEVQSALVHERLISARLGNVCSHVQNDCIKVYTFNDVWVVYCASRRVVGHITTFLR